MLVSGCNKKGTNGNLPIQSWETYQFPNDLVSFQNYIFAFYLQTRGTVPGVALRTRHSLGRHHTEPGSLRRSQGHLDLLSRLCDAGSLSPNWETNTGGG